MSDLITPESGSSLSQARGRGFWPRSALGWIAIVLALVALASWVVFPVLTMAYREIYPVVDSWVMPAIATTLVDANRHNAGWAIFHVHGCRGGDRRRVTPN